MLTTMVNVMFQLGYGIFAAVIGALINQGYTILRARRRFQRSLHEEMRINENKMTNMLDEIVPIKSWDGRTTRIFQSDVYKSVIVNDPILFLRIRNQYSEITEYYQKIEYYNQISESTFGGGKKIPEDQRSEWVSELREYHDSMVTLRQNLEKEYRYFNFD